MTDRETSTRDRIFEAALGLMAERGFRGTTVREIAERAGSRNVAAVRYHFGDKAKLAAEVAERITAELLTALPAGDAGSLAELAEQLVRPLLRLRADRPWGADGVRLLARMVQDAQDAGLQSAAAATDVLVVPLQTSLARLRPEQTSARRDVILTLALIMVTHGVVALDGLDATAGLASADVILEAEAIEVLIACATACLGA